MPGFTGDDRQSCTPGGGINGCAGTVRPIAGLPGATAPMGGLGRKLSNFYTLRNLPNATQLIVSIRPKTDPVGKSVDYFYIYQHGRAALLLQPHENQKQNKNGPVFALNSD